MADARWNVPETEEGLQTLIARLEESRRAGDEAAVGRGLLALAWLVKWVRSDNDEPPFVRAGTLAQEATEIFRRIGDERGLLAALRAPAPFMPRHETESRLDEAMEIAERLRDRREIALTLAARSRTVALHDPEAAAVLTRQALTEFQALGDIAEQAGCLLSLSIQTGTDEQKYAAATEAAGLYREVGNARTAAMCVYIAVMNGESFLRFPQMEPLIREGLADAVASQSPSKEAHFYSQLAKVAAAKGDHEEAALYIARQRALDPNGDLTPEERRKGDIEMTKTLIEISMAAENEEGVTMFEEELRRLRRRPVEARA